MIEKIIKDIEDNEKEIVSLLEELIHKTSADKKATEAQEIVVRELKEMGFETESFRGIDIKCLDIPDYCPPGFEYDRGAYNVAGTRKVNPDHRSLMLFGHIDSEAEDYFGVNGDPYYSEIKDGKIYGLGSSDDKGGIAMMLAALKYVLRNTELNYDLTAMSILGKHGGAFGTLTALMKGYRADDSIYLHPAETGHGFAEIKNISLGVLDLEIDVKGEPCAMHDDLGPGKNSNILAAKVINALEELNQKNRKERVFDFGSFKSEPSYILNIGSVESDNGFGGVSLNTKIKVRIRFYLPYSIKDIYEETVEWLKDKLDDEYKYLKISQGDFKASPCIVKTEDEFVGLIKKAISEQTGITEFIHQYHGGSDIRLPILYGNSKCVGIGPTCILPEKGSGEMEWISIEDYLNGVKILARILVEYNG